MKIKTRQSVWQIWIDPSCVYKHGTWRGDSWNSFNNFHKNGTRQTCDKGNSKANANSSPCMFNSEPPTPFNSNSKVLIRHPCQLHRQRCFCSWQSHLPIMEPILWRTESTRVGCLQHLCLHLLWHWCRFARISRDTRNGRLVLLLVPSH